jgi:DNA repair exonuclease SbcCD nuclease subunit
MFMEQNKPAPEHSLFNIFVFHMAVDLPNIKSPYIEAEAPPELIPEGFNYYAAGHVHKPYLEKFKTGLLAYPGCTETTDYVEARFNKGFYHVRVDATGAIHNEFVQFQSARKFIILDSDFSGIIPSKISEQAAQLVKGVDAEGAIIIPILKGVLPAEANRSEVDVARIRAASEKALLVHPVMLLRESEISEEIVRSIFESEIKDLKTKAIEYFLQIFSERHTPEEAEKISQVAMNLIEPLTRKQEEKVRQIIEEFLK